MKPASACHVQLLLLTVTLCAVELVAAQLHQHIKSNAVTRLLAGVQSHRRDRRQAQTLTTNQRAEILERHNVLRASEGADNMQLMVRYVLLHVCDR